MGKAVDVKKVIVYNRMDGCSYLLAYSVVSRINKGGSTLKTYTIGYATGVPEFDINFVTDSLGYYMARKVCVQLLDVKDACLQWKLKEVEVFDQNGFNVAFSKVGVVGYYETAILHRKVLVILCGCYYLIIFTIFLFNFITR